MSSIVSEHHDDENEVHSPQKEDPYHLKKYKSDYVPADGGAAPLPKTAEPESYHDNRLYVSNIPFSFTERHLTELFSRFGIVTAAMIVTNERGSKGFGFVTMDSVESCEKARHALQGEKIYGRIIEVRKATPLARTPAPKSRHGSNSASSSAAPSPHRGKSHMKRQPRVTPKTSSVAINPHVIRTSAHVMGQPATVQTPCHIPPPVTSNNNHITPQQALNVLLSESPILLQTLLAPLQMASQLNAPFQAAMPQTYFTPTPFYPAALPQVPLVTCGIPTPQQSQRGFPYRVAPIPAPLRQYVTVGPSTYLDQSQQYSRGSSSLNNSVLNGTILSTSMNAHMEGMQDQLVDLLGLDTTMNQSRLVELKGSIDCSLNGSASSTDSDSSRKRRNLATVKEEGSPRKMSRINQSN